MAENVLDSGPPSAKRPKLSSPALSASASDGKYYYIILLINKDSYFGCLGPLLSVRELSCLAEACDDILLFSP